MYYPYETEQLFESGCGTGIIVKAGILTADNTPASARTARRWRSYWREGRTPNARTHQDIQQWLHQKNIAVEYADQLLVDAAKTLRREVASRSAPEDRAARIREAARQITELMNDSDPVTTHYTRIFDTAQPVAIMWASCMHLGGRYTDHEFVERTMKRFSEFGYLAFIGDEIEGFTPSWFHAGSIVEQALQVPLQIQLFDAYMDRFWDRTLLGTWSQPGSMWFEKNQGYNPLKRRYLEHNIPFFDGAANLTFKVGNEIYYMVASHEFPGNSQWNKNHSHIHALRFNYPTADAIIAGDKHTYATQELQVYTDEYEAGRRPSPWVWLIQSGTAKTGPDKYTIKAWSKGQAEWPITVLYPDQHLIKVTRHIEDALRWVEGGGVS